MLKAASPPAITAHFMTTLAPARLCFVTVDRARRDPAGFGGGRFAALSSYLGSTT
jgi:hypothetical protein